MRAARRRPVPCRPRTHAHAAWRTVTLNRGGGVGLGRRRARDCGAKEKDALNILFLLVPLANVALPFVWKNFGFIFSADVLLLFGVFQWKGYWEQDEQEEEGRPS